MSLKTKILAFYEANPEEELTPENMAVKWGTTAKEAGKVTAELHASGKLDRRKERLGGPSWQYVYTAARVVA